jgi:hypothetical protein
MPITTVALGSNGPGWYNRVPVAVVALSSNGSTLSMRLLLLCVTDKRVEYDTI